MKIIYMMKEKQYFWLWQRKQLLVEYITCIFYKNILNRCNECLTYITLELGSGKSHSHTPFYAYHVETL